MLGWLSLFVNALSLCLCLRWCVYLFSEEKDFMIVKTRWWCLGVDENFAHVKPDGCQIYDSFVQCVVLRCLRHRKSSKKALSIAVTRRRFNNTVNLVSWRCALEQFSLPQHVVITHSRIISIFSPFANANKNSCEWELHAQLLSDV